MITAEQIERIPVREALDLSPEVRRYLLRRLPDTGHMMLAG